MAIRLTTYHHSRNIPELPGNNFFHSKELFIVYENTKDYTPILIVATDGNQVLGKMLATIRKKTSFFIIPTFFKKCEVYGSGEYFGEKTDNDLLFGMMLEHLSTEAIKKCFLMEFRNLGNALIGYRFFKDNEYFAINWLRVQNKFRDNESLEKNFSQSRIRQIKRAIEHGAEVVEATTFEEVHQLAKTLHKIYSPQVRRHYPSIEFFQHLKDSTSKSGKKLAAIYVVKYKHKIIGGAACAFTNNKAYLWFSGGMRKTYASLSPGVLAVWGALKHAKEEGYEALEFMDVGLPFKRHTYREFVLRFGGQQSSTRRWFKFRWKWLNKLFRKLYD